MLIAFGLTQTATYLVINVFRIIPKNPGKLYSIHIFALLVMQSILFIMLVYLFTYRSNIKLFKYKPIRSILLVVKAFCFLWLTNVVVSLVTLWLGIDVKQFEEFNKVLLRQDDIFFMISVALIVPIYEEIVFRGFLLRLLLPFHAIHSSRLQLISAILFSSLLFTLIHVDPDASLGIFSLSIIFSIFTIQTNSITLSSLLHSLQNFVSGLYFLYL